MTRSVWILIKYIRELKKRFVSFEIENILFNDYLIDICHTHSSLTITKDNLYELTIRENIFCLFIVEGKRLRGKSPTRWSDQLKESGTLTFYEGVQMAADRTRWMNMVVRDRPKREIALVSPL